MADAARNTVFTSPESLLGFPGRPVYTAFREALSALEQVLETVQHLDWIDFFGESNPRLDEQAEAEWARASDLVLRVLQEPADDPGEKAVQSLARGLKQTLDAEDPAMFHRNRELLIEAACRPELQGRGMRASMIRHLADFALERMEDLSKVRVYAGEAACRAVPIAALRIEDMTPAP